MKKMANKAMASSLLLIIAAVGATAMIFALPGLASLYKLIPGTERERRRKMYKILKGLESGGLIKMIRKDDDWHVEITKAGREAVEAVSLGVLSHKPKKWDGMYRFVMFDIPGEKSKHRHSFISCLISMGFKYYQRSVYIIPWPCEGEIKKLINYYNLDEYVQYLLVKDFSDIKEFNKQFKLN